jgi:hypothetical protein
VDLNDTTTLIVYATNVPFVTSLIQDTNLANVPNDSQLRPSATYVDTKGITIPDVMNLNAHHVTYRIQDMIKKTALGIDHAI